MNSEPDLWAERARQIIDAETDDFAELIRLSGLDPRTQLRCANLSGVSFRGCDLRGFDFTGARLHGCDFTGALIEGAHFDQAEIDAADLNLTRRTNLRKAADWDAYVKGWSKPIRLVGDAHLPIGAVFQDAPFGPEMVVIPPGTFMMGSPLDEPERFPNEGPQHLVTILQPFAVGRYAVTFDEWNFAQFDKGWETITGLSPRRPRHEGWGRHKRPVIRISWKDAQAYAAWLSATSGQAYQLPSEAEWEYCCRAGSATPFWWGVAITPAQANYDGNVIYEGGGENGVFRAMTVPVDAFDPNPFGLYQMHGNVWEWVEDRWHNNYEGAPADGSAWIRTGDSGRILRGGSWDYRPRNLRAAYRNAYLPGDRYDDTGFRLSRRLNL